MKKIVTGFTLALLIFSFCLSCAASDAVQDVISSNSPGVMLLGTVSDIDDKYVYMEAYNTVGSEHIGGDYADVLKVEKFKYTYCQEHAESYNTLKIGDNIFVCLQKNGDTYRLNGVAYKTDTVDARTLNIYAPAHMKGKECMADVVAIAYFVRSNGTDHSFVIKDGAVSVVKDGTETKLYPNDIKNAIPVIYIDSTGKNVAEVKQQDVINVSGNPFENVWGTYNEELVFAKRVLAIGVIFAGIILGMIVVYVYVQR